MPTHVDIQMIVCNDNPSKYYQYSVRTWSRGHSGGGKCV